MKKIYKFLALILSVSCLAAFAACGGNNNKNDSSDKNSSESTGGNANWDDDGWTGNY